MSNFLKKFFNFGFGKDGLNHWVWQRISAVILIFIFSWLIFSIIQLSENFNSNFYYWIKNPLNLFLFVSLLIIVIHHSTLGMLNIFEDYLDSKRKFFPFVIKITNVLLIVLSLISLWHIHNKVI